MAALAAVAGAHLSVVGFASFLFESPVSLLLLLPAIAGTGAAAATDNAARIPLPDPLRAQAARAAWALSWTLLAVLAVNLGQITGAPVSWQSVARNVLIHAALGILVVLYGNPYFVWVPPIALTLASMMFGYPPSEPGYYWWAVIMREETTPTQWASATALFTLALAARTLTATPRHNK
ncbi:hypothetical protein ACX6XY_21695 [Streptomyces sp. O3]